MKQTNQYLKIPAAIANELFKYLNTKPLGEVRQLVSLLEKCIVSEPPPVIEPPQEGGEP